MIGNHLTAFHQIGSSLFPLSKNELEQNNKSTENRRSINFALGVVFTAGKKTQHGLFQEKKRRGDIHSKMFSCRL